MEILFFYNNYSLESLRTKSIFSKAFEKKPELKFRNIEVTREPLVCKKYNVLGTPTTLVLKNKIPILKHLGQLDEKEIHLLINEINGNAQE